MVRIIVSGFLVFGWLFTGFAQKTPEKGPVIKNFGPVYKVDRIDFEVDTSQVYKVVFDVDRTFDNQEKPNPLIETAVRFLNLHIQNGFKKENLHVAIVIHCQASRDILSNKAYKEKFQLNNPNADLLTALHKAGIKIFLCGQTAAHQSIAKEDTLPEVQFALSAMTALTELQNNNYRLIKF